MKKLMISAMIVLAAACAKEDAPADAGAAGVQRCRINDLRIGELTLQVRNTSFDKTLPFLRGFVFGIFRKVAVGTGFSDGRYDGRTVHGFHFVQFGAQLSRAENC